MKKNKGCWREGARNDQNKWWVKKEGRAGGKIGQIKTGCLGIKRQSTPFEKGRNGTELVAGSNQSPAHLKENHDAAMSRLEELKLYIRAGII